MCLCTPCPIVHHMSNDGSKEFSLLQEATFAAIWENWEFSGSSQTASIIVRLIYIFRICGAAS